MTSASPDPRTPSPESRAAKTTTDPQIRSASVGSKLKASRVSTKTLKSVPISQKIVIINKLKEKSMTVEEAAQVTECGKSTILGWVTAHKKGKLQANESRTRQRTMRCLKYSDEFQAKADDLKYLREEHGQVKSSHVILNEFRKIASFDKLAERTQYHHMATFKNLYNLNEKRNSGCTQKLPGEWKAEEVLFHERLRVAFEAAPPFLIVFLDETSVVHSYVPKTGLVPVGSRCAPTVNGNEKSASTAFLWGYSHISYSDGNPVVSSSNGIPLVIFKGAHSDRSNSVANQLSKHSEKVMTSLTAKGWITGELFRTWAATCLPNVKNIGPAWVIVDLHATHDEAASVQILSDMGYSTFFIPAGCTSKMQIHDLYVNKSFKQAREQEFARNLGTLMSQTRDDVHKNTEAEHRAAVIKSVAIGLDSIPKSMLDRAVKKHLIPLAVHKGLGVNLPKRRGFGRALINPIPVMPRPPRYVKETSFAENLTGFKKKAFLGRVAVREVAQKENRAARKTKKPSAKKTPVKKKPAPKKPASKRGRN